MSMYRASSESPIFDAPEIPTLRRMKPLPKRRRTSDSAPLEDPDDPRENALGLAMTPGIFGPDDFIANADSLSAQLQAYYLSTPPQDHFLLDPIGQNTSSSGTDNVNSTYGVSGLGDGRGGGGGNGNGGHDDDGGDGDYIDHLQQPGNTKKRKVPANMASAPHGPESGSGSGAEDDMADRAIPTGRTDQEYNASGLQASSSSSGGTGSRRGRLSKATMAGLQHKELLKNRKRQLAVVLGALSHGDTLALDQALSTTYPFVHNRLTSDGAPPEVKVRPSRRKAARVLRAYKSFYDSIHAQNPDAPRNFPECDFTFVCHSATSDRLKQTREEVTALHARFEAELARQAARAAEAAKQAAAAMNNRQAKRADRGKQSRTASGKAEQKAGSADQTHAAPTGRAGKKKKRSALANASNPHHLRNYVPSRLPHSGQLSAAQAQANAQNLVSPLPVRFLSADVPPRRRSKANIAPIPNLTNPADEWICPFCEYDLFYGGEQNFQRAIRNRKKILKRRRRARERAAAAASGAKAATAKHSAPGEDDVNPGFETPHEDVVAANARQTRVKEGDRGPAAAGGHGVNHAAVGQDALG